MSGRVLTLFTIALAAAPAVADTSIVQRTWLERVAINAADQACNLFSDGERLALRSGMFQAEGELLRANQDPKVMARLAHDVIAHAKSLGCDHPSVVEVAATVRSSYKQFAKTASLDYPAARSSWTASRANGDKWAVMQTDKASGAVFGLRRDKDNVDGVWLTVAIPATGAQPASLQLILRDPNKMPDPWLGSLKGATAALIPAPRAIASIEWAGKVENDKDAVGQAMWVYSFGPAAISRIEQLDPREAVAVDIAPAPRAQDQKVKRIVFEVGDLRAAHAFAMIPRPKYDPVPGEAPQH